MTRSGGTWLVNPSARSEATSFAIRSSRSFEPGARFDAADDDSATGGPDLARGILPVVAVVDSDGYRRAFSNQGQVLIRGHRCPVPTLRLRRALEEIGRAHV